MPRGRKTTAAKTRGDILREFLRKSDVIRKAQSEGLLDQDDVVRMIDGYRTDAAEQELQTMILTQEDLNAKRKEAEAEWKKMAKDALAEVMSEA